MKGRRFKRYGAHVYRDKRWPVLRLMAKRRDGWACVKCGAKGRLEVDHIEPVRDAPEKSFDLDNLQCLCGPCHGSKTRKEANLSEVHPERVKWAQLMKTTRPT